MARRHAWHDDAACVGLPSDLFFGPDREAPSRRREREAGAIAVCADCPVRDDCLAHAASFPEVYGVWGGSTEAKRAAARRAGRGAA